MDDYYGDDELEEIFMDFARCKGLDVERFECLMAYFSCLSAKGREDMVSWMIDEIEASEREFNPIFLDRICPN